MKSVSTVLEHHTDKKDLLYLKAHTASDGEEHIHIQGTPEGFRMLAEMLLAQSEGRGSSGCFSRIRKEAMLFLYEGSSNLLELHCHDDYFESSCSASTDE